MAAGIPARGRVIRDIYTVVWKEWRELSAWENSWIAFGGLAALVGFVGVFLPWQVGVGWVTAPWVLLFWAWLPVFLATAIIADSVAGERERRTLETLLATRLPGPAILLGKTAAAVIWVWTGTLLCVPVGLVTVNLVHVSQGILLYPVDTLGALAAISFLAALLGAGVGVLVSMDAPTVRQAQQTLTVFVLALVSVPVLALKVLPDPWLSPLFELLLAGDAAGLGLAFGAVLLGVDMLLLLIALGRFRRGRLLLD